MDLDTIIETLPDMLVMGACMTMMVVGTLAVFGADYLYYRIRKPKE